MNRNCVFLILAIGVGLSLTACAHQQRRTEMNSSMHDAAEREIVDLHAFFEGWFRGELPNDDASFARMSDVMEPGFHIVTPQGDLLGRERILQVVREAHGRDPESRIWIENVQVRESSSEIVVAMYEEWQQSGDEPARGRLSTVVFRKAESAPHGLTWAHLHETWLPRAQ